VGIRSKYVRKEVFVLAIYSLNVKTFSRANGESAVSKAAYRSGEKLHDERVDKTFDYTQKGGIEGTQIFSPQAINAPNWVEDRGVLWNEIEAILKKSNSTVAREAFVALPHELTKEQRFELASEFSQWLSDRYQVIVDMAAHAPSKEGDERNYHAHIMFTTLQIEESGFSTSKSIKDEKGKYHRKIALDHGGKIGSDEVKILREKWEEMTNTALEESGSQERIDSRSLKEQGIDRTPTFHLGVDATAMERKGFETDRGNDARKIEHYNGVRAYMKIAQDWTRQERATITNRTRDYVATWFDNAREAIVKKYTDFRDRITSERNEPDYER